MRKYNKHIVTLLIGSFILTNLFSQVKTKFGDEVATLDGIIKAYYDVVTVKKGEKISYERDSLLHAVGAVAGMAQYDKDGKVALKIISLREFHLQSDSTLEADGFYEKEISRKVEQFGAVYHVWSTYETKKTKEGPVVERGINSIQLYYDGKRFWILSWFFDSETKERPIPKKYLIKK
jgi:hypothetical protein